MVHCAIFFKQKGCLYNLFFLKKSKLGVESIAPRIALSISYFCTYNFRGHMNSTILEWERKNSAITITNTFPRNRENLHGASQLMS